WDADNRPPLGEEQLRKKIQNAHQHGQRPYGTARAQQNGEPAAGDPCPLILYGGSQLREVTEEALQAVRAANSPPTLFLHGRVLTRLRVQPENGVPYLEPLTDDALRGHLARVADWHRDSGPVPPPMDVVKDLASLPAWEGIPVIEGVVECPVFARDGTLVSEP